MTNPGNAHCHIFPQQGDDQADQRQGEGGNNRNKTNAAKEGKCVVQHRVLEAFVQEVGDHPYHNAAEHAHLQRLNAKHDGLSHLSHGGGIRKLVGGGQVVVDAHVHQHVANESGKSAHRFITPGKAHWDRHGKHQRQIGKSKATDHGDKTKGQLR